jgi:Polyketide synthase dehydratase/Methyltransferase domain
VLAQSVGTSIASFSDQYRSGGAIYQLHPTTIDFCLQLFTVSMAEGTPRRLQKLCVPTEMEELYIRQGIPEMRAKVIASSSVNGMIRGDAVAMAGNKVVVQMKGGKFSPLEDQVPTDVDDPIAGAQLEWKPDIDFMNPGELMRPRVSLKDDVVKLERLALLFILETRRQLLHLETKADHLKKYQAWLESQAARAESGAYALIEEAPRLGRLGHDERLEAIEIASTEARMGIGAGIGKILLRILGQCKAIFTEQVHSIDVLLQEDGLKILYGFYQDMWDCQKFFGLLGHAKPSLRVLEVGAGTGGTTAGALRDLVTGSGERMYSEYCYTDISAGLFIAAQERFKDFQNIHYAVLDISKDPIEQGFEAESYDLILASNVSLPSFFSGSHS